MLAGELFVPSSAFLSLYHSFQLYNANLQASREMFWTYLVRLGDFRRGEELVLVDIMRALLDGDGGLSIEERKSFTWKWNTECCCDKCQRFGVNTHSGSIIQLMANALQQSCVDVTELFYHH